MAACSIQATLANILQRLRIVEDNQSRSNSAIAKLRLEMEDGSSRIQELEFSHESALREINNLLQRFGEQITSSRRKEQEKLRAAFARLREEIEEERNTCRVLKLQNKKLMKELEEANMAAADAGEELDRERQARELMEEVCNELAREIGEDKAKVEQLKQEQTKSREKVEEELKVMRMASLWKEERVKTKISEAQLELDDQHHTDMTLVELKSRVEEFVSTLSATSCESYVTPNNLYKENKDEKQKLIEQAQLLRHALELSMLQVADEGGELQVQNDMDFKEEKVMTPIIENQHTQTDVCDCCSDEVHECENDRSMSSAGHSGLQVWPGNYMVKYSKKPCIDVRQPRMIVENDLFDYNATIIAQPNKLLHDNDVETERVGSSRRIILDTEYAQAPHKSPGPEHFPYESNKSLPPTRKHTKEQSPPTGVSVSGRGDMQLNESGFLCSLSSNDSSSLKGMVHQKQSSLQFEASQNSVEVNGDAWEDDLTPSARRVNCYFEDDVSQVCTDDEGGFSMQQRSRKGCPAFHLRMSKQVNTGYPWKSANTCEEHPMRDDDCIDNHRECYMRHEYENVKSLCADGAESGEEHGEFDGFYFEPVMDDEIMEDDCQAHYRQALDVDGHMDVADREDEHGVRISKAFSRCGRQNRSPKELTCKTLAHDGGGRTNTKSIGTSANKSSGREEPLTMSPPPLHKLVLPTPSVIRVPSVKSQYTSPRSMARSLSPSRAQVLQCFRPPPTSPEHDSAKVAVPLNNRAATKGEFVETRHSGGSTSIRACLLRASSNKRACEENAGHHGNAEHSGEEGQGREACGSSRGALEENKGNSLRAELLKARELDVKLDYSMNNKPAASLPPPPNKSTSPASSFRFSPLRRSLTSTSQQGGR